MDKFISGDVTQYSQIPFNQYDEMNISVVVLDKKWNYLYLNKVAVSRNPLQKPLEGLNMWATFPVLAPDASWIKIKASAELGENTEVVLTSPVTGNRLKIKMF